MILSYSVIPLSVRVIIPFLDSAIFFPLSLPTTPSADGELMPMTLATSHNLAGKCTLELCLMATRQSLSFFVIRGISCFSFISLATLVSC